MVDKGPDWGVQAVPSPAVPSTALVPVEDKDSTLTRAVSDIKGVKREAQQRVSFGSGTRPDIIRRSTSGAYSEQSPSYPSE